MIDDETQFDQFWQASSLDRFSVQQFSAQINNFDNTNKQLILEYPQIAKSLPRPHTQLNKLAQKRRSDRDFSDKALSQKELGQILSSFYAWNGLEHRGYPSAGANYSTEIFCVTFNVKDLPTIIAYYDPETHGITSVSNTAPSWLEARSTLNIDVNGQPQLLVIFVTFAERAIAKYGDRGGRFALLEAGAALQQLSLQIAESSGLKGVAIGGMLDDAWRQYLQLSDTNARIALGYLVGK